MGHQVHGAALWSGNILQNYRDQVEMYNDLKAPAEQWDAGRRESGWPSDTCTGNRNVRAASWRGEALAVRGSGDKRMRPRAGLHTCLGSPRVPGVLRTPCHGLNFSPGHALGCSRLPPCSTLLLPAQLGAQGLGWEEPAGLHLPKLKIHPGPGHSGLTAGEGTSASR